ncbi:MAG: response regulator transcription factor [Dehalococcoidia bacterium]|nr:response regulator transcription factor [Dehalococcoidia bacterium]
MSDKSILIAEDEEGLAATLHYRLTQEGYRATIATDGQQALELARSMRPDLLLLDLMLPVMDGLEVCRILRKESSFPILILTAKGDEVDKVVGLELGADDYVTKPFSMRELLARVKALLRRSLLTGPAPEGNEAPRNVLTAGGLQLDLTAHRAWREGRAVDLKPREFDLLAFLMQNRNRAFTRDHLLDRVWGYDIPIDGRTVDVHVRWLREKIEEDASKPRLLVTVRGVGYRFEA